MYDLSSKFNTFYKDYVVLPSKEQMRLRELKNTNIKRLKEGLAEYNTENKTNYKNVETLEQGSFAMSTITQSNGKDYDIDVAIVLNKEGLPEGTTAVENIIVNALKKKTALFKTEPEFRTNCIRVVYQAGYHIDFAIYRRFKNSNDEYEYEHCGSEWRPRNPRAITKWFLDEIKIHGQGLRKVVRLLKMFCKSRDSWVMPGGLMLSVLVDESFTDDRRLDVSFYETIVKIKDRLENNEDLDNPVDEIQSLILTDKDKTKISNLKNRLDTYIKKLAPLFDKNCSENNAITVWYEFFNHSYWNQLIVETSQFSKSFSQNVSEQSYMYDETEEFIENMFPVELKYDLRIDCKVTQAGGWTEQFLRNMLRKFDPLRRDKKLDFFILTNTVTRPYQVFWKVRNCGEVAEQRNNIRGQIVKDEGKEKKHEETTFRGEHFVECYIIKDGVCVARDRIDVPISTL